MRPFSFDDEFFLCSHSQTLVAYSSSGSGSGSNSSSSGSSSGNTKKNGAVAGATAKTDTLAVVAAAVMFGAMALAL